MTSGSRLASRRVYTGRVINLDVDSVRLPNGTECELEMIRHSGAAAVVPVLSDPGDPDPEVLLLCQYRYAADSFLYEVPAGRLQDGEEPMLCARRELREEAGCTAASVKRLLGFYTTPGFTDEYIHVFVATGLTRGATAHERDELILRTEAHRLSAAIRMITKGEIVDGKTIVALLCAARARDGV